MMWLTRAFALVGLALSIYLTLVSFGTTSISGCGGAILDCDHVLNSRWSKWAGVAPVSLFAALTYVSIFGTSFAATERVSWFRQVLSITVGMAAVWFIGLQLLSLGAICIFCMLTHLCSLAIAAICIWSEPETRRPNWKAYSLAALGIFTLVAGQVAIQPKTFLVEQIKQEVTTSPEPNKELAIEDRDSGLSTEGKAVSPNPVREPNAKSIDLANSNIRLSFRGNEIRPSESMVILHYEEGHFFVKMFDYTCEKCRIMHGQLRQYVEQHPDQKINWLLIPIPMNSACNRHIKKNSPKHVDACEYTRIAWAVKISSPEKFEAFHNWMMLGVSPPSLSAAYTKAQELSGQDIRSRVSDSTIDQRIAESIGFYEQTGIGKVPRLFIDDTVITGTPQVGMEQPFFDAVNTALSRKRTRIQ